VVPQRIAETVVARGTAEIFDMIVLVERGDSLGGQLPADPVRFLNEMDLPSPTRGSQRRRNATRAAADDQDVTGDNACLRHVADGNHRDGRIAVDRNAHDVDQGLQLVLHLVSLQRAMVLGSQSAICGKAMTSPSTAIWMIKYGQIDPKIWLSEMPGGVTPLR
jgi:hypothetical protein